MIWEWLMQVFGSLFAGIMSLIPLAPIDIPSFGPMVGLARLFDGVLPVHEAVQVALWVLAWLGVVFVYQLAIFIRFTVVPRFL